MKTEPHAAHAERSQATPLRPVVFFDGGCPRCRREIAHYQRFAEADQLDWVDLHAHPQALAGTGLDWQQVMREFHVLDADGQWHRGVAAFAELWRHFPRWRWLARLVRIPGIHGLLAWGYRRWAERRFARRMQQLLHNPQEPH